MGLLLRQLRELVDQVLVHHATERLISVLHLAFRFAFGVDPGREVSLKTFVARLLFSIEGALLCFGSM